MAIAGDTGVQVAAPECEVRPFGLMTASTHSDTGDYSWAKGLQFDELPCTGIGSVSMPCPPAAEQLKTALRGFSTQDVGAFAVYAGWECSAVGATEDAWDNAGELLRRGWSREFERAFWEGTDQDGNMIEMALQTGGATDLTPAGGAVDVTSGMALIESYFAARTACLPTIHATAGLGLYVAERSIASFDLATGRARLLTGTRLALGSGYPITGPGGDVPAAGEAWIFGTGPVVTFASPVFYLPDRGDLSGATDRSVNDVRVFAERLVAVGHACGLVAVRVTTTSCCCG